jgi:hypothetical protein
VYNGNDKPDDAHFNMNHIFQAYGAQAALGGPEKQGEVVNIILSRSSFTVSAIQNTTRLIEKSTLSLIFPRIQAPMGNQTFCPPLTTFLMFVLGKSG